MLRGFLATEIDKLLHTFTVEEKQEIAFELLLKAVNLKHRNPFSLRLLDEDKILSLVDLGKASPQQMPAYCQALVRKTMLPKLIEYLT